MANTRLINKLYKKWESLENRPSKGVAIDKDCNPCAQSVAVMEELGMGRVDFKAFVASLKGPWLGEPFVRESLDNLAAKALGISTIHAILLRRFNDFSSENPGIVLKEPWQVLGANWRQVLRFWRWIDSLSANELQSRLTLIKEYSDYGRLAEVTDKQIKDLKKKVKAISVITADLYYKYGGIINNHKPKSIHEVEEGDIPAFSYHGLQNSDGTYSPGYFSWMATWDYRASNGLTSLALNGVSDIISYVTWEIQTMSPLDTYSDLFFCRSLGYNPLVMAPLADSLIFLRNTKKRVKTASNNIKRRLETKGSPVTDGYYNYSHDTLSITEEQLSEGLDYLMVTVMQAKREFRPLRIDFPVLGPDSILEPTLEEFIHKIKEDNELSILPIPLPPGDMSPKKLSWEIKDLGRDPNLETTQSRVMTQLRGRKFNAPKGFNS